MKVCFCCHLEYSDAPLWQLMLDLDSAAAPEPNTLWPVLRAYDLTCSFTSNWIHLRSRKWLHSCHNWSTARRDGSACFCYYLFYLSQNWILNLHHIPPFLTDRCLINTHIKGSAEIAGFFEACLWSWICWANTVHTEPPWISLFG